MLKKAILAFGLLSSIALATPDTLELIQAVPIATPGIEPSGLSYCSLNTNTDDKQNHLVMIADNRFNDIYKLVFSKGVYLAQSLAHFSVPKHSKPMTKQWGPDWEGITCDNNNQVYLLSEEVSDVLAINPQTNQPHWLHMPLTTFGSAYGLFNSPNAKGEGIAWLNGKTFAITAERNPAGILLVKQTKNDWFLLGGKQLPANLEKSEDISDVLFDNNKLYTLQRNHSKICRRTTGKQFSTEQCWSFFHIEKSPEYRYQTTQYGKAEGIARVNNHLYIVLDNNGEYRQNNPEDTRPLMFIFKVPKNWY